MGAAANGQFALVSQTATFLAVVGLLGLDVGVVRHFARAMAEKASLAFRAVFRVCVVGLAVMAAIATALWLADDLVWTPLFGDVVPGEMVLVLGALLVARGGTQLLGALLRSQYRFNLGQAVTAVAIPAAAAIALASGLARTVEEALWAAAFGGLVAFVIGAVAINRNVASGPGTIDVPMRTLFASSVPLWGVGIANNIGDWYGLAVAASLLGASEAGLYRVAFQIAAILQIISVALFSVYSAKISRAHHAEDRAQIALLARSAVRLSTATALPAALLLIGGSGFLLVQIGDEFTAAQSIVYILVIGQLAFTLTGPCGLVLAMSGNERINLAITVAGTLLLLGAVPVAAHLAGLEGIAVCISVVMLLRNLTAYVVVRQKLGINIWAGTARMKPEGSAQ
jgi:O-antigen/teichoic acid export membrane protein